MYVYVFEYIIILYLIYLFLSLRDILKEKFLLYVCPN